MARFNLVLAQALVILGLAPVAYAIALVGWQVFTWLHGGTWVPLPARVLVDASALHAPQLAPVAPYIPGIDWSWANHPKVLIMPGRVLGVILDRVHVGVLPLLVGWAIIAFGRSLAARQTEVIEWQEQARADRLRRTAQYRSRSA
jgi:hypothetical protein